MKTTNWLPKTIRGLDAIDATALELAFIKILNDSGFVLIGTTGFTRARLYFFDRSAGWPIKIVSCQRRQLAFFAASPRLFAAYRATVFISTGTP